MDVASITSVQAPRTLLMKKVYRTWYKQKKKKIKTWIEHEGNLLIIKDNKL